MQTRSHNSKQGLEMKKILLAAASLAASATGTAIAADLPIKAGPPIMMPFHNWTGFYAGINGGGGWARVSWVDNGIGAVTHRSDGGMVGGQLGYRWQMNQFVVGIEGTEDWTRLKDSVTVLGLTENFKVNTLYTVTGQFGWAIDRVLLFVKGGWARATTEITLGGISGSRSRTVNGWTIGGGLDYALWQNWSIGVEYDHASLNYGDFLVETGGVPLTTTNNSRLRIDRVLGRLNYKFN
jgi:outer membrane immunogenic protein